jgi:cellulose biosynthesis protein BcsQ
VGKIVSIVNRKGGVGKTTLTLGLADTLVAETEMPYRADNNVVVVVDLDPQGSLTRALLYDRKEGAQQDNLRAIVSEGRTFGACVSNRLQQADKPLKDFLRYGVGPVGKHYAMLANDSTAWNVERWAIKTAGEIALKAAVQNILTELATVYRYVLIDAPPGQTVIAEAAIQVSDLVLCPTSPDYLSYWGLESFDEYLQEICAGGQGPPARFVFTKFKRKVPRYDPQDQVHELVLGFQPPKHHVTLLREAGERSKGSENSVSLPYDPKLVTRLEGAPTPGRQWPWKKMYTLDTQRALLRIVEAVKKELQSGEPHRPLPGTRATDRAHTDRTRRTAQIAGQGPG